MTWEPTRQSTDIRKILGNLLQFFADNQTEALAWASPDTTLDPPTLYPTAEMLIKKDFPHLGVVKRRVATDDSDDGLRIRYDLTIQIETATAYTEGDREEKLSQLQTDTDNYVYAFESMILNIPFTTLFANVRGVGHGYISVVSADPLERAISSAQAVFNVQLQAMMQFTETP